MNKIELLAPAGDLQRLKTAIMYGADAVYIGGKQFSLRSRASNFDIEDIAEGVQFANKYGAKIHVTVNMLPHEDDLEGLEKYLLQLEEVGVTAIIVASASIMSICKAIAPKLEVHVSTQHSSLNSKVVKYWNSVGVDRVVLGRECTLEDIQQTTKNSILPVEVFIHGGMCISYSGRCVLSNHMTARDANRGGCAQSCRWKYNLYDKEELISNDIDLFSMSSKDLRAVQFIPKLVDANVASLKIEGRMKTNYYIATVVSTYRRLIDEYYETNNISEERMNYYIEELTKAENRPTGIGFLEGLPKYNDHLYGVNGAGVTQEFIAYVKSYDEESEETLLEVRNFFNVDDKCELMTPNIEPIKFNMPILYDLDNNKVEYANKPTQLLKVKLGFKTKENDMIRKLIVKERSNIY